MSPKEDRIRELLELLSAAGSISPDEIASEIRDIGFKCTRCGECCTGEDNSVVAFPFEIRKICSRTGETWMEAVEPPCTGEWDSQGNFHTLEWRIKKSRGSCQYHNACSGCRIYDDRPLICSTYPFYIDGGVLQKSECCGLGIEIGLDEARDIAIRLIERYRTEIEEAIALVESYSDFDRGEPREDGVCIVHDSEGEHRIDLESGIIWR